MYVVVLITRRAHLDDSSVFGALPSEGKYKFNFVQRYDVTWIGVTKETFGDQTGSEWNMREADERRNFWDGLLASYLHKGQQFIKPDVLVRADHSGGGSRHTLPTVHVLNWRNQLIFIDPLATINGLTKYILRKVTIFYKTD